MVDIQKALHDALTLAKTNQVGEPASYIPELAQVNPELTGIAATLADGKTYTEGDSESCFTLQSVAKLVVFIGLLEEFGQEQVFKWINVEPSGRGFAAIDYHNRFSDLPSNPMINAGAIALCSHIPGDSTQSRLNWLECWTKKLFNQTLRINHKIFESERETTDRNRSLAFLMRSNGVIEGNVEELLRTYIALCSFEANVTQTSYLPMLLANQGKDPSGQQVLCEETVKCVVPVMATCGMYNESGIHLIRTGMPAKSGVSGVIIAVAPNHGGLAVFSPRITDKGGSIRGQIMLEYLAQQLRWHFVL